MAAARKGGILESGVCLIDHLNRRTKPNAGSPI